MDFRFDGQTVLVTGAAHGFGRAIAQAFSELGAKVWASDILQEGLEQTAAGASGHCETELVDVSDVDAVRAWVGRAAQAAGQLHGQAHGQVHGQSRGQPQEQSHGRVDVLVNNAGGVLGQVGRPAELVTPEEWRAIFDVNVTGAFYCSQAVIPSMKAAGRGRIVNISSGAGLGVSLTGIQAYASAKAAQIGLTRQLAHELGPHGITVNNVAPGFVLSNPATRRQWESYGEEGQRELIDGIALRRLGSPRDIAEAVLFFSSDHAGWITGQTLCVDGGR